MNPAPNPEIVTDDYLKEHFLLSLSFINTHSRRMGAFSKNPRKFFLFKVHEYLLFMADETQKKALTKQNKQIEHKNFVDRIVREVFQKHEARATR